MDTEQKLADDQVAKVLNTISNMEKKLARTSVDERFMAIDQKLKLEKLTSAAAAEGLFATIYGQMAEQAARRSSNIDAVAVAVSQFLHLIVRWIELHEVR
ncbi:hypothetical protein Q9L58_002252 [Maublancomyces gigas]|uniref:Uncharacterized protein n=1 Tax=Discina gigas TaxID=1032678 RepID=A0ABR3GRX0_9PEZI